MTSREQQYSLAVFHKYFQKLKAAYKQNINEFLENSTIHGLRYFNQQHLNLGERLYFIVASVIVVVSSIYSVSLVTEKWLSSPTLISINPRSHTITDDPFPALTICNMNQALKSRVTHFSKYSKEYAMLQLFCNQKANTTVINSAIEDGNVLEQFVLNISQPCERMLLHCTFGGIQYNCKDIFRPLLTDEGLCCAFNTLDPAFKFISGSSVIDSSSRYPPNVKPVDWSIETGYQAPLPKYYSPAKAVGAGQSLGLNLVLNAETDEYYCSSGHSIGFKTIIHNPNEEPSIHETGLSISPGDESYVRITPSKMETDGKLRHMDMKSRNCVFENEYNLTTFSHYSFANCMHDCRATMIRYRCNCKAPFLSSPWTNITTCSLKKLECLLENREHGCSQQCWPECFVKRYKVNIFSAKLVNTGIDMNKSKFRNMSEAYVENNIAIVKFYLNQYTYIGTLRTSYIGPTDVLSSIGGLIGVFFGFSFISLVEIIYYICIRPLRSTFLNSSEKNDNSSRKPYLRLANRAKARFVNPYRNPTHTFKSQKNFTRPQKMWYNKDIGASSTKEEERW